MHSEGYREGFFIDANLLILLVVGRVQRDLIGIHRRLKTYSPSDYDILVGLIEPTTKLFVTPNTLTETSNLLTDNRAVDVGKAELRRRLFEELRYLVVESREVVVSSNKAVQNQEYMRLGLTDAVLIEVASPFTPVLTADRKLYYAIAARDVRAAENFNHLRDQVWNPA